MKLLFKFVPVLFLMLAINACQKEISQDEGTVPEKVLDADAKSFLNAATITDTTIQNAVNNLVVQLKDAALWNKFKAIYPMVGGSASTAKWNLKDPRDTDAAFRISFRGNPVFAVTGVLFPTIQDYGDTHLYDSMLPYNSNSIAYYSRTQNKVNGYDMGCSDLYPPYNQMTIYNEHNGSGYFGFSVWAYTPANTTGLFMLNSSVDDVMWYENGVQKFNMQSEPHPLYTNTPFLIGWCQDVSSGGQRECGFASISSESLSGAEALSFYNIVQQFQTALNRQVN